MAAALAGGTIGLDPVTCEADLTQCASDLSTTNADLGTCNGNLGTCTGDLGTCNGNLSTCSGDLSSTNADLGTCTGNLSTTNADLGTCTGDLGTCNGSLGTCTSDLGTCNGDLATCGSDLSTCEAEPAGQVSQTGQTICYDSTGSMIACAGTGHDGELQNGLANSFTDNGDGTVTDNVTGLMWEKHSDDGSIHDNDDTYTWDDAFAVKVATLNSGSFAGHNDWRLPNRKELDSLVNLGVVNPSTFSAFNDSCVAACTVTTCSCTEPGIYWSSSTYENGKSQAWWVGFFAGESGGTSKATSRQVRAVRAGS